MCIKLLLIEVQGVSRLSSSFCEGLRAFSIFFVDWSAPPWCSIGTHDKRDLCLGPLCTSKYEFSWIIDFFAARGVYMHLCMMAFRQQCMGANFLCAPYIFLLPMESPLSSEFIWMFIAVWLSSVQKLNRACVDFVQQVWPPFWDSWVSFWIYLFRIPYESIDSLWPYGPICYLRSERGGLYITPYTVLVLHCWTKPKSEGLGWCGVLAGVFSVRGSDNEQLQQHQGRIIFLLGKLGYCQYLLEICVLGIQFTLWV